MEQTKTQRYPRSGELDSDLELVPADQPGLVRRSDLVVVDAKAVDRMDRDGGLLRASDVPVVVEIVTPGSPRSFQDRMDRLDPW